MKVFLVVVAVTVLIFGGGISMASSAQSFRTNSLSLSEKIAFAKWWAAENEDMIDSYSNCWEVSFIEFDFENNGFPEIIASHLGYSGTGGECLFGLKKIENEWHWIKGWIQAAPCLGMQWAYERTGCKPELVSIFCHPDDIYSLARHNRKPAVGAPEKPYYSVNVCTNEYGLWIGNRAYYNMMEAVFTKLTAPCVATNIAAAGGVRDLIVDPDFSALCRLQTETYGGTNGIPTKVAYPYWTSISNYRRFHQPETLSWYMRNLLAETMRKKDIPPDHAFVIVADLDGNSILDAIVTTTNPFDTPNPVPWTVWKYDGRGWRPAENSIRQKRIPNPYNSNWTLAVPPEIPATFFARAKEFYRLWFGQSECYMDAFRVVGPNPWDVQSLFDQTAEKNGARTGLWANGYRQLYEYCENVGSRDFFQLFEPDAHLIQLERVMPEKLIPQ